VAQEYPQEVAIIEVREVGTYKPGEYAHFNDVSGKAWNVGDELKDYLPNPQALGVRVTFAAGNKLKVQFEMHPGVNGRKPSRWVKKVRLAKDGEQISTGFEAKPAWQPRGGGSGNGGFKTNGEFRTPEQIMRGQALEAACGFIDKGDGISGALDTAKQFYAFIVGGFEGGAEAIIVNELDATPVGGNGSFPPDDFDDAYTPTF